MDAAKMERLRVAMEAAVLHEPADVPFFRSVPIEKGARDEGEFRDIVFNKIAKAQFLEPPMETLVSNLEEHFASSVRDGAGQYVWRDFCRRKREVISVATPAEDEAFWREVGGLAQRVGPEPLLVVSRQAEARTLRRFIYAKPEDKPNLRVEKKPRQETDGSYIATVEHVDVYGGDFRAGEAWLFSARLLQAVRYGSVDSEGHRVSLAFELNGESLEGKLRAKFRQLAIWANLPVFEFRAPDPEDVEDD